MKSSVKTFKKKDKLENVNALFNKIMGVSEQDPEIVLPNYLKIKSALDDAINYLGNCMRLEPFISIKEEYPKYWNEMHEFVESSIKELTSFHLKKTKKVTPEEIKAANKDPIKMEELMKRFTHEYEVTGITDKFNKLKASNVFSICIQSYSNIRKVNGSEGVPSENMAKFKTSVQSDIIPGMEMTIKDIVVEFGEGCIPPLLDNLQKYGLLIYQGYVSPCVSKDEMKKLLKIVFDSYKKKISGADKAFDLIYKSLDTLDNNFENYYRDFVVSNDQSVFFNGFLNDVIERAKDTKNSAAIPGLKKIVAHINEELGRLKINNPVAKQFIDLAVDMMG